MDICWVPWPWFVEYEEVKDRVWQMTGMATTYQSAEALVQLLKGNRNQVDEWLPKNYRLSRVTDRRYR